MSINRWSYYVIRSHIEKCIGINDQYEIIERFNYGDIVIFYIIDNISIGSAANAEIEHCTGKYKYRQFICVANNSDFPTKDSSISESIHRFPLTEDNNPKNYELLKDAVDKIIEIKKNPQYPCVPILVYCTQGYSRSVAVLIAYLMQTKKDEYSKSYISKYKYYSEAYNEIEQILHPRGILVNENLRKFLKIYDNDIEIKYSNDEAIKKARESDKEKLWNEISNEYRTRI
jgi:hypothetical protein